MAENPKMGPGGGSGRGSRGGVPGGSRGGAGGPGRGGPGRGGPGGGSGRLGRNGGSEEGGMLSLTEKGAQIPAKITPPNSAKITPKFPPFFFCQNYTEKYIS